MCEWMEGQREPVFHGGVGGPGEPSGRPGLPQAHCCGREEALVTSEARTARVGHRPRPRDPVA